MRHLTLIIIVAALTPCPSAAAGTAGSATAVDFATFIAAVGATHPEAALDRLTVERAAGAETAAGALPDPKLQLGRQYIPLGRASDAPMSQPALAPQWQVSLTQSLPWPGTLDASRDAAHAATQMAENDKQGAALTRRLAAEELFVDLVASSEEVAVHRASLADTDAVLKSAVVRVKNGIGTHHELIAAENAKSIHGLDLAAMEADLANLEDHAAQMMGREDATGLQFALTWPDLPALDKQAPDLTRSRLELARTESLSQLEAERDRNLPHFMASGMLMQDDTGMRMAGVMAGVSLPVFSGKVRSGVADESTATAARTDGDLAWHERKKHLALRQNARRRSVLGETRTTLAKEIVPNARQHLQIILADYAQGRASFTDVNAAQEQLLQLRLAEVSAHRDALRAAIARERILAGFVDVEVDRPTPQLMGGK